MNPIFQVYQNWPQFNQYIVLRKRVRMVCVSCWSGVTHRLVQITNPYSPAFESALNPSLFQQSSRYSRYCTTHLIHAQSDLLESREIGLNVSTARIRVGTIGGGAWAWARARCSVTSCTDVLCRLAKGHPLFSRQRWRSPRNQRSPTCPAPSCLYRYTFHILTLSPSKKKHKKSPKPADDSVSRTRIVRLISSYKTSIMY